MAKSANSSCTVSDMSTSSSVSDSADCRTAYLVLDTTPSHQYTCYICCRPTVNAIGLMSTCSQSTGVCMSVRLQACVSPLFVLDINEQDVLCDSCTSLINQADSAYHCYLQARDQVRSVLRLEDDNSPQQQQQLQQQQQHRQLSAGQSCQTSGNNETEQTARPAVNESEHCVSLPDNTHHISNGGGGGNSEQQCATDCQPSVYQNTSAANNCPSRDVSLPALEASDTRDSEGQVVCSLNTTTTTVTTTVTTSSGASETVRTESQTVDTDDDDVTTVSPASSEIHLSICSSGDVPARSPSSHCTKSLLRRTVATSRQGVADSERVSHQERALDKNTMLTCSVCGKRSQTVRMTKQHSLAQDKTAPSSGDRAKLPDHSATCRSCRQAAVPGKCTTCCRVVRDYKFHMKQHTRLIRNGSIREDEKLSPEYDSAQSLAVSRRSRDGSRGGGGDKSRVYDDLVSRASVTSRLTRHQHHVANTCPICQRVFAREDVVKGHIRRVHMKERPYACRRCGRSFVSTFSRQRHEMIHNNEYRYYCQECGDGFRQKQQLTLHMQHKHNVLDVVFEDIQVVTEHTGDEMESVETTEQVRTEGEQSQYQIVTDTTPSASCSSVLVDTDNSASVSHHVCVSTSSSVCDDSPVASSDVILSSAGALYDEVLEH